MCHNAPAKETTSLQETLDIKDGPNHPNKSESSVLGLEKLSDSQRRRLAIDYWREAALVAEKPDGIGAKVEIKHLQDTFDNQGNHVLEEQKYKSQKKELEWWEAYVLCVVQKFARDGTLIGESLRINSEPLKTLLNKIIHDYPGVTFNTPQVTLRFPLHCLYHHHVELQSALDECSQDSNLHAHLSLLLKLVREQLSDAFTIGKSLLSKSRIRYDLLWTIFKPNSLIYSTMHGQHRAFVLKSTQYIVDDDGSDFFSIVTWYTDFDGTTLGAGTERLKLPTFEQEKQIEELDIFPLEYHPNVGEVKWSLLKRGELFHKLCGTHDCEYEAIAIREKLGEYYQAPNQFLKTPVAGRVKIDTKSFNMFNPLFAIEVNHFDSRSTSVYLSDSETKSVSSEGCVPEDGENYKQRSKEHQIITCHSWVRGFSFKENMWMYFFVEKLRPVFWDEQAISRLVIPHDRKELVQALVTEHVQSQSEFDDTIKGKGKGLVFLLHGPPGVGKTLTAECIAEYSKHPLYTVTAGSLGSDPTEVEGNLSRTFSLAEAWNAILLIDEADIFLEQRSEHESNRNALVSIFLRSLEYYQGILFLTTNRLNTFDDAFQSRIHVAFRLDDLTPEARKAVWRQFLISRSDLPVDVSEEALEKLGTVKVNGREIKNIAKTAGILAKYRKVPLVLSIVDEVLQYQQEFRSAFH